MPKHKSDALDAASNHIHNPGDTQTQSPQNGEGSRPSLEQRMRQGAQEFRFDSLLEGVSTLESASHHPSPNSALNEPVRKTSVIVPGSGKQSKARSLPYAVAAAFVLAGAAIAVFFVVSAGRNNRQDQIATNITAAPNPFLARGLPDPALSPGEHTNTVSSNDKGLGAKQIPYAAQREVLIAYGLAPDDKRYAVCHVIPPMLGGTDNAKNLFPTTPWFRGLKRRLDMRMVELVMAGKLNISDAQTELATDWVKAVHRYPVRNYGETNMKKAQQIESQTKWGK